MNPDDFKRAWQAQTSQTRLKMDPALLLEKLQRDDRSFSSTIFWRDFREVGVSLLMVPLWIYLGVSNSYHWTWFLMVPTMLWVAGFMLVDRIWHRRQPSEAGESLRWSVARSLAEVEHQIWLLRHVFWWYLLPLALPMLVFFGQIAWREWIGNWWGILAFALPAAFVMIIFAVIYRVNQYAVRAGLEPRRQELETLLLSLGEEPPDAIG
jgi:hypothetical protein